VLFESLSVTYDERGKRNLGNGVFGIPCDELSGEGFELRASGNRNVEAKPVMNYY